MTSPEHSADVVRDCVEAKIPRVWLHRGVGQGSVSQEAIDACNEHGITVIEGQCPLMFVKDPHWVHRVHAFGKKLTGNYPKE